MRIPFLVVPGPRNSEGIGTVYILRGGLGIYDLHEGDAEKAL